MATYREIAAHPAYDCFSYFCSKHRLWIHVRLWVNEYPQSMFWIKHKKNRHTHADPSYKMGLKGVFIARTSFPEDTECLTFSMEHKETKTFKSKAFRLLDGQNSLNS